MIDLINRQDIKYHTQLEAMGNGQYEEVEVAYKNDIDALPSAEPPYQYSEAYVTQIRGERDVLQDMVNNMADAVEVVRCKDCKHRCEAECPMYFEEQIDIDEGDGYYDTDYIFHDYTKDDGYCYLGERRQT